MIEGWRWFGPLDKIALPEVAQTGASAIVTALHEVPYGEAWTIEAIRARQAMIADAGVALSWDVVESLPVHEDIKLGIARPELFANYRQSLENLATCGITTICYNFMPLLDWTRTTLDAPVRGGGTAAIIIGIYMFFRFFVNLLYRIPLLGDVISAGVFLISLVLGLTIAIIVMTFSILIHHPFMVTLPLVLIIGIIVMVKRQTGKSKANVEQALNCTPSAPCGPTSLIV